MTNILRVDMTKSKVSAEHPAKEYEKCGGRGLGARILNREVPAAGHPLGKYNKLIFAPGLVAGSRFPSSGRVSVVTKSPLTEGIKEANVGGTAGVKLGRLGIKAIVVEGEPANSNLYLLKLTKDGATLMPADELAGLNNYATAERLRGAHGKDVAVMAIGRPGEMRMALSSVSCTNIEGKPSRHAARGGVGAAMGAKGLKAIVIDDTGTSPVAPKNDDALRKAIQEYANEVIGENKSTLLLRGNGTLGGLQWISDKNMSLPTRNFTAGSFEGAAQIGSKQTTQFIVSRGGKFGEACMPGCILKCSNIALDDKGEYLTSGLEYESSAMLGANVGISDFAAIMLMERLCDDYGLDTIEAGVTLGLAVDCALLKFGEAAKAMDLLHEIGRGTTLGKILGQGAAVTGRVFGISRVPVVKGQGIPAHEPRVENGTGVTYCTSPQGADHTAGLLYRRASPAEVVAMSRERQIDTCVVDSLGMCLMASIDAGMPMEMLRDLVNAQCGFGWSTEDLRDMGKAVLKEEREFNRKAGFTQAADRLPDFFSTEPLPPSGLVFDVSDSEIDAFWDF